MEINDVIKELKEENERCFKECEGMCNEVSLWDGVCTCRNVAVVSMLEELNAYRKIGTADEFAQALEKSKNLSGMCEELHDKYIAECHRTAECQKRTRRKARQKKIDFLMRT